MIEFMKGTEKDRIGIRFDGEVSEADFGAMASLLRERIEEHGRIRLVIRIDSLGLVEPAALWEEVKLAAQHFEDVERIALVGDARWQKSFVDVMGIVMPAECEMKHFTGDRINDAWEWIG